MKIFPHTLIRYGGDSFEEWARLNSNDIYNHLDKIINLEMSRNDKKTRLCDNMFEHIESIDGSDEQNQLQNLRRDIYNSRKLKTGKINKALEILPSNLKTQLEEYVLLSKNIKELVSQGEHTYNESLVQLREELKKLVDKDAIRKGLLLSSKSLLARVNSYIERDSTRFRKKEVQIEQGLIKYLTRMYAKTSPFSTFTNLAIGAIDETNGSIIEAKHKSDKAHVSGHIRLNNQLFKYIFDLLKNYKPAYLQFKLRPNPTLINEGENFLYLTNNNNIESFQRIPFNPVVELILDVVNENATGITFANLVSTLQDNIEADQEELEDYVMQLITYGCLEYNLGVSGIDPDWDLKLISNLKPLIENEIEHISELIEALEEMRKLGQEYEKADVSKRENLLKQAFDSIRSICMKIHEKAGLPEDERKTPEERQAEWKKKQEEEKKKEGEKKEEDSDVDDSNEEKDTIFKHETSTLFYFKPEQIFYEDTTREAETKLDHDELTQFVKTLDGLLQSFRFAKGMQDERDFMKHYFVQKYGEKDSISLLKFYEDYFRDYKRPKNEITEKKKQETLQKNLLNSSKIDVDAKSGKSEEEVRKEIQENLTKLDKEINDLDASLPFKEVASVNNRLDLLDNWNEQFNKIFKFNSKEEEINIHNNILTDTNSELSIENAPSNNTSFGSFVQFYVNEDGKLSAVFNSAFSGFGKMLSRFLHILDPAVTDDLRKWNISTNHDDSMLIEDCDASYFNANLHPPLMPLEIWMPGGHNTLDESAQIPITDFDIAYDSDTDKLWLKHKPSGKNSHVFDLGFQGHMGRSQLFQLLEKFSKAEYLSVHSLMNAINYPKTQKEEQKKEQPEEPKISIQPRVVYENKIVLQRKTWNVPKSLIPERDPMDTDWTYYSKINQWRIQNDMPDEVFVFINPNRWNTTVDPKLTKKLTRDDYKPQYIDFRNPLLIMLLEKLITKVPQMLKIQEMLPNSNQMVKIDDKRYVSEFVVQWYK